MADPGPTGRRANDGDGPPPNGRSDLLGAGLFVYFVALIAIVGALLLVPILL
jgi:hypothetical protein